MNYLIGISLMIFVSYVLGMVIMFGAPASISDTYYKLEKRKEGLGWLFTAFCWGIVFTLIPALLEISKEDQQYLIFLAGAGLGFVGVAPQFKIKPTSIIHYLGALVCIAASQYWCFLNSWKSSLIVWLIYMIGTLTYMGRHMTYDIREDFLNAKPMFWIEIAAFVSMYAAILFA